MWPVESASLPVPDLHQPAGDFSFELCAGFLLLQQGAQWWLFERPLAVIAAYSLAEVQPALAELERAAQSGLYAAGMLSYEAAPALDPALRAHPPGDFPLLWFGLYTAPRRLPLSALPSPGPQAYPLDWRPNVSKKEYRAALRAIKAHIACGDTYQVNYTLRLRSAFPLSSQDIPFQTFCRLARSQRAGYAAYLDLGRWAAACASPELFFRLDGDQVTARPMKGTTYRGLTLAGDRAQAAWLQASAKNRAENVMIVDMLRNDLGKVARPGSVQVLRLFETERYPTVWQMTSTVQARTEATFSQLFSALFPCASITGAPKIRTMQIIQALEPEPRRLYTGSIGWLAPGRQAQFNVAIRTVLFDRHAGHAEYGVGGGIVWDSTIQGEYEECLLKARVLNSEFPAFSLLETLRWTPTEGYYLLERHLQRMKDSAEYFAYPCDLRQARERLAELAAEFPSAARRVRLLLDESGVFHLESMPFTMSGPADRLQMPLAVHPVDRQNTFLYHKTTHRSVYAQALQERPGCEDVILFNQQGELTETCLGNLALNIDGRLLTPPLSSGLLAGVLRAELLASGVLQEARLTLDDLPRASAIYRLNSLRGMQAVDLTGGPT